jgi:branched-chain amino acid transport system substrate-binding protein
MKGKIIAVLTGAVLLLAVTGAWAQAKGKISGGVVKIGVLDDMSSLYADIGGQGDVTAAQMAVDEFGGKVLGAPIQVVSADHQNKPDVGASKAREWYDSGVNVIVGMVNSGVTIAVSKVANEKHRLVIDSGAGSTRLTNEDCNPYTIHYEYDTFATGTTTAKPLIAQGDKTWFFITADYAFGKSLQQDTANFVQKEGGKVLGSVLHPLNASDFSSYLLQAQASGAQVIGLANAGGDTINSVKAASEFGITRKQKLAALLIFDSDVHSLGLKAAQGLYAATGFYWDHDNDSRKFAKAFAAKMGGKMPTMVQAGTYSSTLTYLKAIQAAGTDDPDAVMKQLKSMTINDNTVKGGKIRPDGRMVHEFYLYQVKSPSESKGEWDLYKLVSTVPADQAFQPLSESRCPLIKKK